MIDEYYTFLIFGYHSDELSNGSHKYVVAVCDECGTYHRSEMRRLKDLCHSCGVSGERSHLFGIRGKDHWKYGMTGEKSLNFGYRWTGEQKKRLSLARADISGKKNPQYGKRGKDAGHWKGGKTEVTCYACGKKIRRWESNIHDKNFCNIECKRVYDDSMENRVALSATQQNIDVDEWNSFVPSHPYHKMHRYGCEKLNGWFLGSHAHHVAKSVVIYIPDTLHRHIPHNLKTGHNMGEMNMLAIQYNTGWW